MQTKVWRKTEDWLWQASVLENSFFSLLWHTEMTLSALQSEGFVLLGHQCGIRETALVTRFVRRMEFLTQLPLCTLKVLKLTWPWPLPGPNTFHSTCKPTILKALTTNTGTNKQQGWKTLVFSKLPNGVLGWREWNTVSAVTVTAISSFNINLQTGPVDLDSYVTYGRYKLERICRICYLAGIPWILGNLLCFSFLRQSIDRKHESFR